MNQEDWRLATPQYEQFQPLFEQFLSIKSQSFLDLQPRLRSAIQRFDQLSNLSRVLLVNSPDNAVYRELLISSIREHSLVPSSSPVICAETLNIESLFDHYSVSNSEVSLLVPGLLSQADGGYLVISANLILANPSLWIKLKSALLGQRVQAINSAPKQITQSVVERTFDIKLIVVGDRGQLADLDYLDEDIQSGFCLFGEIEMEMKVETPQSLELYLGYLKWLTFRYQLPQLSIDALPRLLTAGARETEDQEYLPVCVIWHNTILTESAIESNHETISFEHIDQAIDHKAFRENYLPNRAIDDILDGQVIIETEGEQVGQVNGLTVIDVPGHPISYGEPVRISCVIHFGDGDISDVERKAELGGNLHAKGMMIMQAFVSSALNLDEPLPYAASVVFEQSYCEVDGDSASLAELCSLVSALSEYPINQQIAVTGAVDQFGRVQAVGGLNEKIEGFYRVCEHQGFTGKQGVVLPKSNLKHLALHKDVVNSIKNNEFHIWSVSNVDEAIPIIMDKPFRGDQEDSVINKIAERIENFERHEHPHGIVDRIKNWFA